MAYVNWTDNIVRDNSFVFSLSKSDIESIPSCGTEVGSTKTTTHKVPTDLVIKGQDESHIWYGFPVVLGRGDNWKTFNVDMMKVNKVVYKFSTQYTIAHATSGNVRTPMTVYWMKENTFNNEPAYQKAQQIQNDSMYASKEITSIEDFTIETNVEPVLYRFKVKEGAETKDGKIDPDDIMDSEKRERGNEIEWKQVNQEYFYTAGTIYIVIDKATIFDTQMTTTLKSLKGFKAERYLKEEDKKELAKIKKSQKKSKEEIFEGEMEDLIFAKYTCTGTWSISYNSRSTN